MRRQAPYKRSCMSFHADFEQGKAGSIISATSSSSASEATCPKVVKAAHHMVALSARAIATVGPILGSTAVFGGA